MSFRILLAAFLIAVSNVGSAAELCVITHPEVSDDTLTVKELQRIYYGKMTRWSNDASIIPVMLVPGEFQDQFIRTILNKTPEQFKLFWRQAIFTGEGAPPREFRTQSEMMEYIAKHPGTIGFAVQPDASQVKTIMIIEP